MALSANNALAQSCGIAPIDVQVIGGSYACSAFETSPGSGEYNVVLTVKMADGDAVKAEVRPTAAAVEITNLEIRSEPPVPAPGTTTSGTATIEIRNGTGANTFARIGRMVRVSQVDPNKLDDVVLDVFLFQTGSLGSLGGGGEVVASRIDQLRCAGDISFDEIRTVRHEVASTGASDIVLVQSDMGSIFSDIRDVRTPAPASPSSMRMSAL